MEYVRKKTNEKNHKKKRKRKREREKEKVEEERREKEKKRKRKRESREEERREKESMRTFNAKEGGISQMFTSPNKERLQIDLNSIKRKSKFITSK